ncbi:MAG: transposase [Candidatus Portnoybacteria bacterium]|nr:transposase [Candidatus Portnoybacteria bacterium]
MKKSMAIRMKPTLAVYHTLKEKVTFLYHKLKLFTHENTTGRKLSLPIIEIITLALYKQTQHIQTKKAIWDDFQPSCSYKTHGTKVFKKLNDDLNGIFVADAEYVSEKLEREFYLEHKRILFARPRKNMGKLITTFQYHLYNTRMLIELNFRNLKMFYGLLTSLPRSINGYLANYFYSILAYALR